jgi:hypothetical protein
VGEKSTVHCSWIGTKLINLWVKGYFRFSCARVEVIYRSLIFIETEHYLQLEQPRPTHHNNDNSPYNHIIVLKSHFIVLTNKTRIPPSSAIPPQRIHSAYFQRRFSLVRIAEPSHHFHTNTSIRRHRPETDADLSALSQSLSKSSNGMIYAISYRLLCCTCATGPSRDSIWSIAISICDGPVANCNLSSKLEKRQAST